MTKRAIPAFLCAACLLCGPAVAGEADSVVGVWKLVSYVATDPQSGESVLPFGEHPNGYLIYTTGGRMSALLTAQTRGLLSGANRVTAPAEDRAEAFSTSSSYMGTYRWEGDRVVHRVDIAENPNWVGTDQVRQAKLERNRLTLTTPPLNTRPDGKLRISTLVWERIE